MINMLDWAKIECGEDFSKFIEKNYTPFDILYNLANDHSIILLNGDGFASCRWGLRVSLANLNDESYIEIGKILRATFNDLKLKWEASK